MSVLNSNTVFGSGKYGFNRLSFVVVLFTMCLLLVFSSTVFVKAIPHASPEDVRSFQTSGNGNEVFNPLDGAPRTENEYDLSGTDFLLWHIPSLEDIFQQVYDYDNWYICVGSILIGGLFLLLGKLPFRLGLGFLGGYLSVWGGFMILNNNGGLFINDIDLHINLSFIAAFALIGILVCLFSYKIVSFFAGTIIGYFFGKALLRFGIVLLIQNELSRFLMLIISASIVGLAILLFEKITFSIFLPMIGSFLICFGGDYLFQSDFRTIFYAILTNKAPITFIERPSHTKTYFILAAFGVLCLLGCFLQASRKTCKKN